MDLIRAYRDDLTMNFSAPVQDAPITRKDVIIALNLPSEEKYKFICMNGSRAERGILDRTARYLSMIRQQEALLGDDYGLN